MCIGNHQSIYGNTHIERQPFYRDCSECGGACCKFFTIPLEFKDVINTTGVPLNWYISDLESNPSIYFSMHEGITVIGQNFIVDKDCETEIKKNHKNEDVIVVKSKCTNLDVENEGKCRIYSNRPSMCKNFVAYTAIKYNVPLGCIFDSGNIGRIYII